MALNTADSQIYRRWLKLCTSVDFLYENKVISLTQNKYICAKKTKYFSDPRSDIFLGYLFVILCNLGITFAFSCLFFYVLQLYGWLFSLHLATHFSWNQCKQSKDTQSVLD